MINETQMDVDVKQLRAVQRLRQKYRDNEAAYDALLYYLLTDGGARKRDLTERIKGAIAFCASSEGEAFYEAVLDHGSPKASSPQASKDALRDEEDIYEYSHEWAKAARHKDGMMSLKPGVVSPEFFAMQALSRFSKRI